MKKGQKFPKLPKTPIVTTIFKQYPKKTFKKGDWVYHEFRLFQITSSLKSGSYGGWYDISNGYLLTSFRTNESHEVFGLSIDVKGISEWFKDWAEKFKEVPFINHNTINRYLTNKWAEACREPKKQSEIYDHVMKFYGDLIDKTSEFQMTNINDELPFNHLDCGGFV